MRKRSGRKPRFAAVPNETIDDAANLDFMALGLLNVLLRHQDGWEITLPEIGAKYGYGRDAMAGAMGLLQVARYVVKVRMMSVVGNQWSTEVCVYDTPATDAEVAALLAEVERLKEVRRAQIIQPTAAAIANAMKRRAKLQPKRHRSPSIVVPRVTENPDSGATCGNEASGQVGPDCRDSRESGDPALFKKTVGKKKGEDEALAARSGGDGRRPSDRSNAGAREGGFAASDKDSPAPSKKQPKHSRQELDLVAAVRRYFPQELAVPDIPAVSDAVLKALATGQPDSRTVEQLGARIETRWYTHRYAMKLLEGEKIESPVGVAIDLVRAYGRDDKWGCANPRCEVGKDADTEADCPTCPERLEARKAARSHDRAQEAADSPVRPAASSPASAVPEQRPAVARVQMCQECDRGFRSPEPGLCRDCREDAATRAQQPANAPF
ncbi:hypothetical protein [Streptomyces tubercidicus]|uniref:hypothetical protein n=1 Tax=Streptomyces tubercidicus TaxID=47759 RepID=UPI003465D961